MPMHPFTPAGVSDFLVAIYALSDTALAAEAAAVQSNFRTYVAANFTLNTTQSAFLAAMPNASVDYLGSRCAFCFIHRRPIVLVKPQPPITEYSKILDTEDSILTSTDPSDGSFSVTGAFTVTVVYVPA